MPEKSDLPQGTLDLLILKVVALGAVHGYAIAQRLEQVSRGVVQVPGLALSGVAPARKPRSSCCGLGGNGEWARGEVLSPDAQRADATGNGSRELAAID